MLQQQIHQIRPAESGGFMQGRPAVRPLLVNCGTEVQQELRHVVVVVSYGCGNKPFGQSVSQSVIFIYKARLKTTAVGQSAVQK